jgi:uncharacterized protein YdcH (DUF465 family)
MDDREFREKLRKLHDDHARFMALLESQPPLTEEQKRGIAGMLDEQKRAYDEHLKQRAEAERQAELDAEAREAKRQEEREKDPAYWKRLYLTMVEREEERKRQQENTRSIRIVAGIIVAVLVILTLLFGR